MRSSNVVFHFKEQERSKFYQEMTVLLKQQKEDVDSGVINHSPYYLALKFAQLEGSQDDWFKKTANKKEACIQKFRSAKMSSTTESPPACQPNSLSSTNQRPGAHITIEFENIKSAHPTTLQHLLEKAEDLLNNDRAVMHAPSSKDAEAFMVESETTLCNCSKKRKSCVQRLPRLECIQDLFPFFSRS